MVKREIVVAALKKMEEERTKQIAEIKYKLASLRKAITDILAAKPDVLWNIEELGKSLKPSKIVCFTKTELEKKSKSCDCDNCQNTSHCPDECHCEDAPTMCDACLDFLFQVLNFMASQKEIDMFSFYQEILVGIHIESE